MCDDLTIIHWPDPRLKKVSEAVSIFDDTLRQLADRMVVLMREAKGVGLAAPQVGRNLRLFVVNATGQPEDTRIYINPVLIDAEGSEEGEEGCLSLPGINVDIVRSKSIRIQARDLTGQPFEQFDTGYLPRIWQHEFDHVNGVLLTDRMGAVAKMKYRKTLRELEAKFVPTPTPAGANR
jgi:peptide deformylase